MWKPLNKLLCKLVFAFIISLLALPDISFAQRTDTLLMPFDQGEKGVLSRKAYRKLLKRIQASDDFYYRIKRRADSGYIYKQIYPLIFRKPQSAESMMIDNLPANFTFRIYKNDVIRSIRIIRLKPLGTSIYDTIHYEDTGLAKTLNNLHFQTAESVIRKYLNVKEGDRLNPVELSDDERVIRNLPIFDDARFIIDPVSYDSLDLILVVKDVFPIGADLKVHSIKNSSLRVFDRNLFGLGHQVGQTIGYNFEYSPSFYLGDGNYTIRNIRQTFTDFSMFWSNNPLDKKFGIDISRPFFTPEIRFAGGLTVSFNRSWLYNNNSVERYRISNRLFDTWAGYSMITNRLKDISSRRQQIAITARLYQLDYLDTPRISLLNMPPMVNTTRLLFGFNILRSEYYRTNMLYGYGRTEDIPFGHHAEVVFGWEHTELINRFYTAIKLDFLKPTQFAGLLGMDLQIGGYLKDGYYQDGVLITNVKVISPLIPTGKSSIRNFAFLGFTTGLHRSTPGLISVNDGNSGNIFNNYERLGYKRIRGRFESVVFTPQYFLGFRFAPFIFAEAAVIAPKDEKFTEQTLYPAFGLGMRFRNENLVFSTFQFSFAWHPVAPDDVTKFEFFFSDLPHSGILQYLINKPDMVQYR